MRINRLRPYLTLLPFALYAFLLIPIQWLAVRGNWRLARTLPVHFHRCALKVLGVKLAVAGKPAGGRPLLLTANHASWLDIVVLSALFPVSFVAKSEIAHWPLFGTFARLQRSVFIERERRSQTGRQAEEIAERLGKGDAMVLFAEGTTSDGCVVLPFRSALIGAARGALQDGAHSFVTVQPVAIAYTHLHGLPLGRQWRPLVAWIGNTALPPHLLQIAREGAVDVLVAFGEPLLYDGNGDRKEIAAKAEASVREMLSAALTGRTLPVPVLENP